MRSGLISMVKMLGAYSLRCSRGAAMASVILPRMCSRADARLLQRLHHDFAGQALNFGVHLDGGDAVCRSGHLEVHVAGKVFHALDVGKHGELVAERHQAHRDARQPAL